MKPPQRIGRYLLFDAFARGGMASMHYGRITGPVGFSRVVAIKRHHPPIAKQPEFVSMIIDEARIAGRIRHPNIVPVLDVVAAPGELLLVMEYVAGLSLAGIWRAANEANELIPPKIAAAIVAGALQGLHAAHETSDDKGSPLGIVHRDVSPQNILVGNDGLSRVTDFGVAQARERLAFTRTDVLKGKIEYMPREQLRHERLDRRADVFAASVVLWEALTGDRLFSGEDDLSLMKRVATADFRAPSSVRPELGPEVDALVAQGLAPEASERFPTALAMVRELSKVIGLASQLEVGEWVERIAGDELSIRAQRVTEVEHFTETSAPRSIKRTMTEVDHVADSGTRALPIAAPSVDTTTDTLPSRAPKLAETKVDTIVEQPSAIEHPPLHAASVPPPAPRARSQWVLILPLIAFVIGITLLSLAAFVRWERSARQASPIDAPAPASSEPVPSSAPEPTAEPVVEAPSAAAEAPSASSKTGIRAPRPAVTKRGSAAGSKPASDPCDPPFVVDKQGVKIPKPECFKR